MKKIRFLFEFTNNDKNEFKWNEKQNVMAIQKSQLTHNPIVILGIFRLAKACNIPFSFYHCNIYVQYNWILLNGKSNWTDHEDNSNSSKKKEITTNVSVHILIVFPSDVRRYVPEGKKVERKKKQNEWNKRDNKLTQFIMYYRIGFAMRLQVSNW